MFGSKYEPGNIIIMHSHLTSYIQYSQKGGQHMIISKISTSVSVLAHGPGAFLIPMRVVGFLETIGLKSVF